MCNFTSQLLVITQVEVVAWCHSWSILDTCIPTSVQKTCLQEDNSSLIEFCCWSIEEGFFDLKNLVFIVYHAIVCCDHGSIVQMKNPISAVDPCNAFIVCKSQLLIDGWINYRSCSWRIIMFSFQNILNCYINSSRSLAIISSITFSWYRSRISSRSSKRNNTKRHWVLLQVN